MAMLTSSCLLGVLSIWTFLLSSWIQAQPNAYERQVLIDLCQFMGVKYVRDPDNRSCGYIACWDHRPFSMPCAPGLKVHPYFQWGDSYACTEKDVNDDCGYLKKVLGPHQIQKKADPVQAAPPTQPKKKNNLSGFAFAARRK